MNRTMCPGQSDDMSVNRRTDNTPPLGVSVRLSGQRLWVLLDTRYPAIQ
jgi:hypothetical protein